MIKLVASDLDGTLLKPDKTLPEETFDLIGKLYKRGIIFTPASGRQLPNLKNLFSPVLDKIAIIAENGGLVWFNGKIVYQNPTPADSVKYALCRINGENGLYPLLSCADCAYYESDYEQFTKLVHKSYSSAQKIENLFEIADDITVIKISVWDDNAPCAAHAAELAKKIKGLRTMASGFDWFDVSVATANKGEALHALMKHLALEPEECAAFGDHMNDLEMLQVCGNPYAVENAFPALKEKIKNRAPSNAELGVIQKLKELLK